jgi:hypothetical protein
LLEELKYNVISTDLIDRGYGLGDRNFFDFEKEQVGREVDILTNPPYKYAKEFVLHALDVLADGRKCYMFLKLTFLEGKARFKELFSKYPPKNIYVFSERIMCAKNGKFKEMEDGGGSMINIYEYDTATKEECIADLVEIIEYLNENSYDWYEYADFDVFEKKGQRIQYIAQRLKQLKVEE